MSLDLNNPMSAGFGEQMHYILYDFTQGKTLADIHLPVEEDNGPVLLKVTEETYTQTVADLREMCVHEGDMWMTTLLIRPEYAPTNTSDLEQDVPYIVIAHISLLGKDGSDLMRKLCSMKQWLPN